jgi:hypothetical protein
MKRMPNGIAFILHPSAFILPPSAAYFLSLNWS